MHLQPDFARYDRVRGRVPLTRPASGIKVNPTADVWVQRDKEGQLRPIAVVDMEPGHLLKWIEYFRRKQRAVSGFEHNDDVDAVILKLMITARAIYTRAVLLGLIQRPGGEAGSMLPPTEQRTLKIPDAVPLPPGRMISFEED